MSDYSEFFLSSKSSVIQFELLEISHPNFTKTYRVVRNSVDGLTVTLEDLSVATFDYYPLSITGVGTRENLDFGIQVALGDLGEVLPIELDQIAGNDGYSTLPIVKFRSYRSDDLTAPLVGPITLEIETFNFNREGSSFEAKAPSLNISETGEAYKLDRFSMLRGFL